MIGHHVGSVRSVLVVAVVARAAMFAASAAVAVVIATASLDLALELSVAMRRVARAGALVVGAGALAAGLWRDRHAFSLRRVALWIEEQEPSLEYALVTALERGGDLPAQGATPERWVPLAGRRSLAMLTAPLAAMAAVFAAFAVLPDGALARARSPRPGDAIERPVVPAGARPEASRLDPLVVEVRPPAYRGERARVLEDPSSVGALVGSAIEIRGRGDGTGIGASVGGSDLSVASVGQRWSVSVAMPPRATAVRLTDRDHVRLLGLEPAEDPPPAVTLQRPLRDSVVRTGTGRIPLEATAVDDHAIASAAFELIVSSGEGESFTFRTTHLGAVGATGARAALAASLSLDSLALRPGDIVHLRAVARDFNTVTGPGMGASETRTIRVARLGEYDSVAVEAAGPLDEEHQILSQRMLIMLAEALDGRRPRLGRAATLAESRRISVDQKRLRRTVGEIVFMRLSGEGEAEHAHGDDDPHDRGGTMEDLLRRAEEANREAGTPEVLDFAGGESPVVAVNRPLLEAYNAMWDAAMELDQGDPRAALPHMRRALEAIQRARAAERVYLRGRPQPVVVDLGRVRMQGRERGASSERAATDVLPLQRMAARLSHAIELHATDPAAAVDTLLMLRLDALQPAPAFALALGEATDALRRGNEPGAIAALARARRAVAGPTVTRDSLSPWAGGLILP